MSDLTLDDILPREIKLTSEQEAIVSAVRDTRENIMVDALAGCAKSTTSEVAAKALPATEPILALAFNVKIKKETERRFPKHATVLTMNGLGHRAFGQAIGKRLTVEASKLNLVMKKVLNENGFQANGDQWSNLKSIITGAMNNGLIPAPFNKNFRGLVPDEQYIWADITEEVLMTSQPQAMLDLARACLIESIKQSFQGVVSFDDQIYCSTMLGGIFPRFPTVFIDESQDLSPLNHIQLKRCAAGRIISVGDPRQCHPPGTMVSLSRGKVAPIEKIVAGTQVISYVTHESRFVGTNTQGRKVLNAREFDFDGNLVRIIADGKKLDCTPEHRCLVKFNSGEYYCIYLMRKGDYFRIGISRAMYNTGFGPIMRARQEGADAVWVLSIANTKEQALIDEKVISTRYSLPDIMFKNNGKASTTQHFLDAVYNQLGPNRHNAIACLADYGRYIEYPLWSADAAEREWVGFRSFVTQACNLIPSVMSVKTYNGKLRDSSWASICIDLIPYKGKVYGLEVEPTERGRRLYVANGIVTHNSIYGFRGADTSSMSKIKLLRASWIELKLSTTFRCPKLVVARQQTHAPGYTAAEANLEGEVHLWTKRFHPDSDQPKMWTWAELAALQRPGEALAILCRNNGPLLSMAFKLIRQGIGCTMLGRDIGKGLIALSRKIIKDDETDAAECSKLIQAWAEHEVALARANEKEEKIASITDRAECLLAVIESAMVKSAGALRRALEDLFSRETGLVTLGSIHRAKGLEWDAVVMLDPWRIPSRYAREAAQRGDNRQLEQEYNLKYVGETRTKRVLVLANLEDFE